MDTYKVWQSVARPETPIRHLSLTLKTLWKLQSTVISWVDRRVSVAIATQFLPFMAIMELPLYSSYHTKQKPKKLDLLSQSPTCNP